MQTLLAFLKALRDDPRISWRNRLVLAGLVIWLLSPVDLIPDWLPIAGQLDDLVVFHPLGREQLRAIVNIQLEYLRRRLRDREIELRVSDAALARLAEAGYDPVYGARPLKRAIQQQIENPLAQEILQGRFAPGDVIEVDAGDAGMAFAKAA